MTLDGATFRNADAAWTLSPDRFMNVCGSSNAASIRTPPTGRASRTKRALNFSLKGGSPALRWSSSATIKPTLCRCPSCSRPGLPSPTTRNTRPLLLLLVVLLVFGLGVGSSRRASARSRARRARRRRRANRASRSDARCGLFDFLLRRHDRHQGLLGGEPHDDALGQLEVLRRDV